MDYEECVIREGESLEEEVTNRERRHNGYGNHDHEPSACLIHRTRTPTIKVLYTPDGNGYLRNGVYCEGFGKHEHQTSVDGAVYFRYPLPTIV